MDMTLLRGPMLAGKHLTFRLADTNYGMEILKVREIMGLLPITVVPRVPHYVRGVINLRGKVIPVVDLRAKFGLLPVADTAQTCIIVVATDDSQRLAGILVDAVSEVREIAASEVEPSPELGGPSAGFLRGLAKLPDSVVMLLDIDLAVSDGGSVHTHAA